MNVCKYYVTQLQWQWGIALGCIVSALQAGGLAASQARVGCAQEERPKHLRYALRHTARSE
jgi:hypothetical protein